MFIIKKFIKHILKKFNIGIYRITINQEIESANSLKKFAIDFNSLKKVDSWYSISKHVDDYLSKNRISFYNELINLSVKEGVVFENKNVLDMGCGPGALLNELNKRYKNTKFTGIDFSEKAIMYARKKMPGITFKIEDIFQYKIDKKYDIIFCTEVLEHLAHPSQALKKMLELMNEKGVLILTVPNGKIDTFIGHINFWSPESWAIFLKEHSSDCEINTFLINKNVDNIGLITKKS